MKLGNKPLKIEGDACGKRIVDSLYKAGNNYYFLDTGWPEASSHPDHCIGKLIKAEREKWTFQDEDDRIFVITPINDEDQEWGMPMLERYNRWKTYLKENYPNADGARFVKGDFGLEVLNKITDYVDIQ
jgi:hypothetical protein